MVGSEQARPRPPSPTPSSDTARTSYIRRDSFMAYTQGHSNHFHLGNLSLDACHTPVGVLSAFLHAILATALFRCWHILLFFLGWATMVTLVNEKVTSLTFQPTLLTVVGTVLGFVISYRTTSSFERYNEGRRYWSQIILASRTLARAVWFHVPELPPATPEDGKEGRTDEERKARNLIEKKTVINLIEAFSVAVKHYLRGEEGIAYVDLYHLVKFLPSYAFPAGVIPSEHEAHANLARTQSYRDAAASKEELGSVKEDDEKYDEVVATGIESRMEQGLAHGHGHGHTHSHGTGNVVVESDGGVRPSVSIEPASPDGPNGYSPAAPSDGAHSQPHITLDLPLPVTTPAATTHRQRGLSIRSSLSHSRSRPRSHSASSQRTVKVPKPVRRAPTFVSASDEDIQLLPASLPPRYGLFDVFPFSLFVKMLNDRGRKVEGKKAAKLRAKTVVVTRNVPLEISMYLTSYVSTLGARKAIDVPTNNLLILSVNQLTDALTGLERILTTPIPFSYSIHLWVVTIIYNLALPFQIYSALQWVTIPACGIVSFIFFGFLVAGEEIENPFGYDKNDLNLDHFTHNIIRNELRALTAFPPPPPDLWAFSPRNDRLFAVADPMLASRSNLAALKEDLKSVHSGVGFGSNTALANGTGVSADNRSLRPDGSVGAGVGLNANVSASVGGLGAIAGSGAGLTPEEWVRRGTTAMRDALARAQ